MADDDFGFLAGDEGRGVGWDVAETLWEVGGDVVDMLTGGDATHTPEDYGAGGGEFGMESFGGGGGIGSWLGSGGGSFASGGGSALATAQQIVEAVLSNPVAQDLLMRTAGVVFSRPPQYGSQPINQLIVRTMWGKLPKPAREAIAQRLSGLDTPLALNKSAQEYFLALYLYDAFRALGVMDVLDLVDG